jgi:hypothetical protein
MVIIAGAYSVPASETSSDVCTARLKDHEARIKALERALTRRPASLGPGESVRALEKDLKIHKLENENAQMKSYLCHKDPSAPFCK